MTAATALLENLDSVKRLARSFARYGYDPEDLEQQACLIFLELWDSRPTSMPVTNFIRSYVNWRLIDFTLQGQKKKQGNIPKPELLWHKEDAQLLSNMVLSLSADATNVFELLRTVPREVACYFYYPLRQSVRLPLIEYLHDCLGWTKRRATQSIQELERACLTN